MTAHDTMNPLLGTVWETGALLDAANRSNNALDALAPAGYHINALTKALTTALELLGIPEHDTDTVGLQIQGRIRTLKNTPQ